MAQGPVIYQPLARDIAAIYGRKPGKVENEEVIYGALTGGVQDIAVDLGTEFFREIAMELVQDVGLGTLTSIIPILGGIASTAIDSKIAWTMTWRVGLMLALYHENGGKWIESRKHTYELVRRRMKIQSKDGQARPTIRQIVEQNKAVIKNQEASVGLLAQILLDQGFTKDEVRESLTKRQLPRELIDAVLSSL